VPSQETSAMPAPTRSLGMFRVAALIETIGGDWCE
jgi:hypothetical protein